MTNRPPVTRDGAQHAAHQELSKAIYKQNADPWPVRVVKWFGHLVDKILNKSFSHAPGGSLGAFAVVLIVVVVIGLVIWRVGVPRRAASTGAVLAAGRTMSAAEHRQLSEAAATEGNWHDAVLERMRALARQLEERSILDARAGRTATELATEAARRLPDSASQLTAAAGTFNDVIYGGVEGTPSHLAVIVAADERVVRTGRSTALAT